MNTSRREWKVRAVTMWCAFLALALLVAAPTVSAQSSTATVLGTVKDASGAVVAGASLTARNVDTNLTRTATTGSEGTYRFDSLPVGNYEIRAEQTGFKESVRSGLTFTVAQQAVLDFTLEIGEVAQQVQVSAAAVAQVDTTSPTLGAVVDEHQVTDLPLNGRNYAQLALLQSGINEQKNRVQNATANLASQGTFYSSNGAPTRANRYLLDGTNLSEYGFATASSISGTTLGIDGIREFKILTNSFDAEYGMSMGSQMLVVSKGGTNSFHGDAFDYLRNSALNARNYFDTPASAGLTADGAQRRLPPFRQNNFGGAFGGPIKKDKTFFYGVFEGIRSLQGLTELSPTIPAGCRGAAGATITSAQCSLITTTTSTTLNPGYGCTQPGGAASVISCTLSPQVAQYLATTGLPSGLSPIFPLPNTPGNQVSWSFASQTQEDYGQMRVDQTFSPKDNLFGRYTVDNDNTGLPESYPGFQTHPRSRGQWGTIAENHIFSPTLLNTATFGYSRSDLHLGGEIYYNGNPYTFGTTGPPYDTGSNGFIMGSIAITGVATNSTPGGLYASDGLQTIYSYSDDLFWTKGRQALKFGTLINHYQIRSINGLGTIGSLIFNNYPQFLSALASSYAIFSPGFNPRLDVRYNTLGFYVQDDVRVSSKLTVNLGLRYEPNTNMIEIHGHASGIRNLATDAQPTPGHIMMQDPSWHNISPRFGFAWDPWGNGKTAVRGGVSYLQDVGTWIGYMHPTTKQLPNENPILVPGGSAGEPFTLPFSIPSTLPLTTRTPTMYEWYKDGQLPFDPGNQQPRGWYYNLSIQRQVPWSMVVTLAYAGSRNYGLLTTLQGNVIYPGGVPGVDSSGNEICVPRAAGTPALALNQLTMTDQQNPTACYLNPGIPGYTQRAASSCPGPTTSAGYCPDSWSNQNWGAVTVEEGEGQSSYNSLQASVEKRFQKGLQFQGAFTWARLFDTTEAQSASDPGNGGGDTVVDPLHPERSWGPANFDIPVTFRLNLIYTTPMVQHANRLVGALLNQWRISPIFQAQSGSDFDLALGTGRALPTAVGNAGERPDLLPGRNPYNVTHGKTAGCGTPGTSGYVAPGTQLGTQTLYFDPCAFYLQPRGFFGDTPRNWLRGPNYQTFDLSLVKDTRAPFLGEAGMVEFRAEGFNIFNRANFSTPNRTVYNSTSATVEALKSPTITPVALAGEITQTLSTSRQIQLVLKFMF